MKKMDPGTKKKTSNVKRSVLLLVLLILAVFAAYRLFFIKHPAVAGPVDQPLHIGKNSGAFNTSFEGVLDSYYALRDALVEWDTLKANQQAYALSQKADSLPFKEMKADSILVLTAKSLAASVGSDAVGLIGESGIEQKRREFNMLTDEIYNLVRTVRYDGTIIYHMRCPMAFNDSEEGFWLTNANKVLNPYMGKRHPHYGAKMLGCGEVNDSLDFSK
jgi:hypothetical protein